MAIQEYRDFVLLAEDIQKDAGGVVNKLTVNVFDSPVGQGQKKEIVSVPADLFDQMGWLEDRTFDTDAERQMELGEILASLLLPTYARQMFGASLARLRDGEGLRLRLRLADELADFPWEYMYIQDERGERTASGFLALDPRISIVRHEAVAVPGDWFEAPGNRRVVVAMATPKPHEKYPKLAHLPAEQKAIKTTLSEVAGIRATYLPEYGADLSDEIPGTTGQDLMQALLQEHTDVFHFAGHGEFMAKGPAFGSIIGEGAVVLADAQNNAFPMSADRLAELVKGSGARLVVLGACETGRRDNRNVWSSVAMSLLKAAIPAVVAMQFTIQDDLAAAFSEAFYRALVVGLTVDEAVSMGRLAMRTKTLNSERDVRDWGVPVLYLRAPTGRVFNPVSDAQAHREAEKQLGHLFEQHVGEVKGRVIGPVIGTMQDQTVAVDQTVDERVSGVMLGGYVASMQGGRLKIQQTAGVVDEGGTMIGAVIPTLGGPATVVNEQSLLAGLEQVLRWTPTSATAQPKPVSPSIQLLPATADTVKTMATIGLTCPNCHGVVQSGDKFCIHCGQPLPSSPKYCTHCGAELGTDAQFCARCGTKVI